MNNLTISVLGLPAANRDLKLEIRDPITQEVIREARPFLDGTAQVSKIPPGAYELFVRHPNLELPVFRRPIRVLPVGDTRVSVLLDPSKFRNAAIEDIPEANLGPVSDVARSVAETITPLAAKHPGEAILAQDWNALASSVRDLAENQSQLVALVSPTGHNHPELEKKINEMSDNFQQLLETLSASLAELQRQIQVQQLGDRVRDMLDLAGIDRNGPKGKEFLDLVDQLKPRTTDSPTLFGQAVRNTGVQLETKLSQLLEERSSDPNFAGSQPVQALATAVDIAKAQRTATYSAELDRQRAAQRKLTGGAFNLNINR